MDGVEVDGEVPGRTKQPPGRIVTDLGGPTHPNDADFLICNATTQSAYSSQNENLLSYLTVNQRILQTRMHFSKTDGTSSAVAILGGRGVSAHGVCLLGGGFCLGGLCPGGLSRGVSVREGLCPGASVQGVSVWGISVQGIFCLGGLCPGHSLSRGSLSRDVSVQGGVTVQGDLCPGGFCLDGLCPGGSLPKGLCPGRSRSRWSLSGDLCPGGSLSGGGLCPEGSLSRGLGSV